MLEADIHTIKVHKQVVGHVTRGGVGGLDERLRWWRLFNPLIHKVSKSWLDQSN